MKMDFTPLIVSVLLAVVSSIVISYWQSWTKFPLINVKKGEWSWSAARKRFMTNAAELLHEGLKQTNNGPFCIITDRKLMTYLPPHYAELIKNDRRFSFTEYAHRDMMGYLPGFDPFGSLLKSALAIDVVQKRISPNLDRFSDMISSTTATALAENWGDSPDFHQLHLQMTILAMVSRVTARVFVGEELSSNPDWLRLNVTYTVDAFMGAKELGRYPWGVRHVMQWFNPRATRVRQSMREAYKILVPILEKRPASQPGPDDAIEWNRQLAGSRKYDEVVAQVGLALAAIHTTGDLLFKSLSKIAEHWDDIITPLREEIISAVSTHGLNKTGVYHMQLLDSILKETQRLDGVALTIMNRYVIEDATLPNGVTIPKGSQCSVITEMMRSEETYAEAKRWDPYRFYNLRRAGQEQKAQLVSATAEHIAFGLGKHACPGRFFAAHELKIMLAHILLKYDVGFVDGDKSGVRVVGTDVFADNTPRVQVRRRKEEIKL
ncbi:cytochrome P450 [Rhypophila sp. PSN 637]